jgi:hypothetical protein
MTVTGELNGFKAACNIFLVISKKWKYNKDMLPEKRPAFSVMRRCGF